MSKADLVNHLADREKDALEKGEETQFRITYSLNDEFYRWETDKEFRDECIARAQDAANETGTQVAIIADDSVVPSDDQVLFLASPVPNA